MPQRASRDSVLHDSALEASFKCLKYVGPETAQRLEKLVGGGRLIDLILHKPSQLRERCAVESVVHATPQVPVTFLARVSKHHVPPKRGRVPYRIDLVDAQGVSFRVILFQGKTSWVQKLYPVGQEVAVSGTVVPFKGSYQMTHPDFVGPPAYLSQWVGFETVYPLTEGISLQRLKYWLSEALQLLHESCSKRERRVCNKREPRDWWDEDVRKMVKMPSLNEALHALHMPCPQSQEKALRRLSLDELLVHQILMQLSRSQYQKSTAIPYESATVWREQYLQHLGFSFTAAQTRVLEEIDKDMSQVKPMMRLLQGDVGSGKTAVGFCALLNCLQAGDQAAFLVPTEILARQHYQDLQALGKKLDLSMALLVGSLTEAEKRRVRKGIGTGEIQLVIGTHALVQESVVFQRLGALVIDEQHRFGVEQRLSLTQKGMAPHVLGMSATPIPRSLALTLHGELDLSVLDEKPPGRQEIQTKILSLSKIDVLVERLNKALARGEQAYWVCPLVENSEALAFSDVQERFKLLQARLSFPVGLIHGRLKADEKQRVMASFQRGEVRLLVSTTVIEVGVNVPQATIMVIDHGERFGLAQLHQLRGRVGRGVKPSSCVITYGQGASPSAIGRLQAMAETNDGFKLAEIDLKNRGGGEFFGRQQSGHVHFRFADPYQQTDYVRLAHRQAKKLIDRDPQILSVEGAEVRRLMRCFGKEGDHQTVYSC